MNDTYRLDNQKQILHTKQYVENSKSNLMLKVSQQDNVKKDFTLHLLSRETSKSGHTSLSLWHQRLSIEEWSINLLHDGLTSLLFLAFVFYSHSATGFVEQI